MAAPVESIVECRASGGWAETGAEASPGKETGGGAGDGLFDASAYISAYLSTSQELTRKVDRPPLTR